MLNQDQVRLVTGERGKVMSVEPLVTESQRCFLKVKLSILSEACPLDQSNPSTCPFHEIRERSHEERMAWLAELSDEALLNVHTICNLCWVNHPL